MPSWARIAIRVRVPLGFIFAAAYLWFARPTWPAIVGGEVLVLAGLAVRAAASGHIRKNTELTTTGPYAYTRNPLYLGSVLIAAGFVVAAQHVWLAAAAAAMFVLIYLPVIRAEENYLRSAFPGFADYARRVPRFFPRLTPYSCPISGGEQGFSRELYKRHREYNAALGSFLMMAVLILKILLVQH